MSHFDIKCPICGQEYPQENILAHVKSYPDGVTTVQGLCKCDACISEVPLKMIFRADSSAEITVGNHVKQCPRGNILVLVAYSVAVYFCSLIAKLIPAPTPPPKLLLHNAISNKRSANIIGTFGEVWICEWMEVDGQRYYFNRVMHSENEKPRLALDEIIAYGCLVYKSRTR